MEIIEKYKLLIEKEIDQLDYDFKQPSNLYEPIDYILSLGGKRMRPILCIMASDLFEGTRESAINQAMAVELFHNFSLIHDDIMDEAPLRRGKETVHVKWNSNIGILSGDAMLVKAYEFMSKAGPEHVPALLKVFNQTALEVCEGQQYDMDFESRTDVSIVDYLHMIELKTAVLLGAALKMGAIVAGASEEDQNHLYEFGRNIGIAFQLQDDILDVYADPEKFGKQVGGDIILNKKTFLLLRAFELADQENREALLSWTQKEKFNAEEKVVEVRKIYDALNVRTLATAQMNQYFDLGMEAMRRIKQSDEKKKPLISIAEQLMQREM
jgi:geranylgeranyl diphosphate synthase type II